METCLRLLSLGAQANFFHPVREEDRKTSSLYVGRLFFFLFSLSIFLLSFFHSVFYSYSFFPFHCFLFYFNFLKRFIHFSYFWFISEAWMFSSVLSLDSLSFFPPPTNPAPPGERHHPTACGCQSGSDPAGGAAGGVRRRPRCPRHQRTHTDGLRQVGERLFRKTH